MPHDNLIILLVEKTLADGIPKLVQHLTESGGSIPSPQEHSPCERRVFREFLLCEVPSSVLQFSNRIWGSIRHGHDHLLYATESTLLKYVTIFLEDILRAMKLSFQFENDLGIKHISPDICVLTDGKRLVGVVEVKKPDKDILLQPTVLGELFDQLFLVEGFYTSGPVIGILTSLKEWLIAWFVADNQHFTDENPLLSCFTPTENSSPEGLTPSQTSGWKHGIENEDELESEFKEDEFDLLENIPRILSTTEVMNIFEDYTTVLKHIYTSFLRMNQVNIHFRRGVPRSLFKLHKDEKRITWHPLSEIPIDLTALASSKFPRKNTRALLAVEDLGRGSSGKAWLTCTLSKTPAICVLKYSNKGDLGGRDSLNVEKSWWDRIYPEFSTMTKVEIWSGSYALVMPHFCSIPENRREDYRDEIYQLLVTKFEANELVHQDVRWRNIGVYLKKDGDSVVVLYDLQSVRPFSSQIDPKDWTFQAVENLYKTQNKQDAIVTKRLAEGKWNR